MSALKSIHRSEYEGLFRQGRPVLLILGARTGALSKELQVLAEAVGEGALVAVGDLGADPAFGEVLGLNWDPLLRIQLLNGYHLERVIQGGMVVRQRLAWGLRASSLARKLLGGAPAAHGRLAETGRPG